MLYFLILPGIEGKRTYCSRISIKSAVEKAHVIFYVSKVQLHLKKGDNGPLGTMKNI